MTLANKAVERYQAAGKEAETLIATVGKLDEANQVYLNAIPDEQLTPADCFVLGNTFFKIAPELSAKYHERAFNAFPDDPYVNLEWAMILHLRGQHQEAAKCYRKCLETLNDRYLPHALLADCLVRTGDLKEAVKHWQLADHPSNHTGIDFAIHSIYGELSPHYRHQQIWKAIETGQTERLDELIVLAANWDTDWWNQKVNAEFLNQDLNIAQTLLGEENPQFKEFKLYAATYLEQNIDAGWLKTRLNDLNLILAPKSKLPQSAFVTDRLLALVIKHGLATESDLKESFERKLRDRGKSTGADGAAALNTLATLILAAENPDHNKLEEIDKTGWDKHHEARFAASLLVGLASRGELQPSSALLKRAQTEFPDDRTLCMLSLELNKTDESIQTKFIVDAIKAEYRHLSVSFGIIKDSYRLKWLFAQLEATLQDQ